MPKKFRDVSHIDHLESKNRTFSQNSESIQNPCVTLTSNSMKRFFAIGFLLIFLLANTELHQLLRLPVLLSHFQEHLAQNQEIDFIEYLLLHYTTSEADADFERDQQLPFKGQHTCAEISLTTTDVPENTVELPTKKIEDSKNYTSYYKEFFTTTALLSIWQPPKV